MSKCSSSDTTASMSPIGTSSTSSLAPTTATSTMSATSTITLSPATSTNTVINTSTTHTGTSGSPTVTTSITSTETSETSTSTGKPATAISTTMSSIPKAVFTTPSTTPMLSASKTSMAPTTASSTITTHIESTLSPGTSISTVIYTSTTSPRTSASPILTTINTSREKIASSTYTVSTTHANTSSTNTTGLLFNYGNHTQDLTLRNVDDACSTVVTSSLQFPMYGILYTDIYICSNGIVSFSEVVNSPNLSRSDNDLRQYTFLAPYFTDLDLRQTGSYVYYHAYDMIRNYSLITDNNVQLARDFVRKTESDQEHFFPTFLLVVTWEKVLPYPATFRQSEAVSFQLALVTDAVNTFAFYVYFKNQMKLQSNDVFIGYAFHVSGIVKKDLNSFTKRALTIDSYVETNGQTGLLYYRLTPFGYQFSNDERFCRSWWSENRGKQNYYKQMNEEMPSCPCSQNWLWLDSSFGNNYFQDSNTYCSVVRPRWSYSPHGKEYHKITYTKQYKTEDERMKDYCCYRTNLCYLYYELRPVSQCYNTFPYFFAVFWGDPHIETLDKKKFTFNGWGENTLVSLETDNVTFHLQSRTSRAVKTDRIVTDATIFSAFAAMDNLGANVHVELSRNKDGELFLNLSSV
ncbi:hypothetical protein CHS0354_000073 [Potamilus streckersoni]|uniref:NIDO domain-containing protein n=1 Tax=Potamilus streckersoni TaxID=2493646 RepID=A0AAE0SUH2_9BIVA|nr:hypothetical protein CHS0354_000073 [Potamilus streckersoni]